MKIQRYLPTGPTWDMTISRLHAFRRIGYWPDLSRPRTFNELILSSKSGRIAKSPLARRVTDKVTFKEWLEEIGEPELVIPTLLVSDSIEELQCFDISEPVVVKPTHSSGRLLIRNPDQGRRFDEVDIRSFREWLAEDYYLRSREMNYEGLQPRIIIERMLRDEEGELPKDFKVFCVDGRPTIIQVDYGRFVEHTRQLYDADWNFLPFVMAYPRLDIPMEKPAALPLLLQKAAKLSRPFNLVRVDFYVLDERTIKAGEVTFFPGNGAERFTPPEGDMACGQLLARAGREGAEYNE